MPLSLRGIGVQIGSAMAAGEEQDLVTGISAVEASRRTRTAPGTHRGFCQVDKIEGLPPDIPLIIDII
jgi:hypothetical protein